MKDDWIEGQVIRREDDTDYTLQVRNLRIKFEKDFKGKLRESV